MKTLAPRLAGFKTENKQKICPVCNRPRAIKVNYYSYSELRIMSYNPVASCTCDQITEE